MTKEIFMLEYEKSFITSGHKDYTFDYHFITYDLDEQM